MNDPNDLQELHEFIYDRHPDILIEEVYEHTSGVNKEPNVVSIIVALGGPVILRTVQTLIKNYYEFKIAKDKESTERFKEEENTKRLNAILESNKELFKLKLKSGKSWENVSFDDFSKMSFQEYK